MGIPVPIDIIAQLIQTTFISTMRLSLGRVFGVKKPHQSSDIWLSQDGNSFRGKTNDNHSTTNYQTRSISLFTVLNLEAAQ